MTKHFVLHMCCVRVTWKTKEKKMFARAKTFCACRHALECRRPIVACALKWACAVQKCADRMFCVCAAGGEKLTPQPPYVNALHSFVAVS